MNAATALSKLEQIRKSGLFDCVRAILGDFAYSRCPSIYFWTVAGTPKWSHKKPEGVLFYKLDRTELIESAGNETAKDFALEITKFLTGEQ